MKKKLFYAAGFFLIAWSFNACDGVSCKVCSQNTYNSTGGLITAGSDAEYCDAELVKIEATPPVTVLGVTSKWVCK